MIKLLLRLLFLLLPFAVLVGTYERKYHLAGNNQYVVKRSLLESAAGEVEILTLGSSHGYRGILPQLLGRKAFNLAATGQSIYYDVELALKYLPKLPHLNTVILPISYFSLERQLDQGTESWRCYYYYKFYSIPHRTRDMADDIRNFSLYFLYGRNTAELINHDATRDFDSLGGIKEEKSLRTDNELQDSAAVALRRHHSKMNPAYLPENIAALEKLRLNLQQRNIRLFLITTPVTHYYREGIRPAIYDRMQHALNVFCKQNSLTYSNYLSDERFTPNDFSDADHLNHNGAVKFSQFLAKEVLRSE